MQLFKHLFFLFQMQKIIGCWFHFGQCLFRKQVNVGLKVAYGQDEDLKLWFKGVVALALLPPEKLDDAFVELMDQAPLEQYSQLSEFFGLYDTNLD